MSGKEPFTLRWGILATGGIAKKFTTDLLIPPSTRSVTDIQHVLSAAASSTSVSRAQEFLTSVNAPASAKPHGSYAALAADPSVDIIYIATPHSHHYANARLCLEAGKSVLCEKPFTVNAAQAEVLVRIAREKGVFLMEAVWTRFFPIAREIRGFVAGGGLGEVKRVWADLSFWNDVEREFGEKGEHRMVNMDLAGGALLDLGIYSLTWIFQILYHIQPPSSRTAPITASAITKYHLTGCDETTSVLLTFPSTGAQGIATTSIRVSSAATSAPTDPVRIQGTHGDLTVAFPPYRPWQYTLSPAESASRGKLADWDAQTVEREIPGGGMGMFWEADECARCIRDGKLESEVMGWEESLEIMRVMDKVRKDGGVIYSDELESVKYP
ncbi:NAD(P)-binding protein [Aaosphaeria arxii CBS 175.79]|uniref:D-xylose 1-dehydrogenase (NADP(+), D-xylono-1,5-lactone-forming) n=1 Tax=Aaosphaeria arxii CBS 175.79 TaxID=1450172 RepID=A0A6A5XUT5_9PLEO|nr:NAD(P)-binding protein [Aaosphaeria arxii CBS 175.79]KAF2016686.1 NAD(P)-binding protein [Aaosphaeria arxii CBS 175.79]